MSDVAPDEGFLAGDKPRQRHTLAGLPLGEATLACECVNHHHYLPWPHDDIADFIFWGYLWTDGELTSVKTARKFTTRESDALAPRLIEMEPTDVQGRVMQLRGTVEARMPWQTSQNMNTVFCQMRWESAGRVDYGDSQEVQFGDFVRRFARVPA